MCVQQVGSERAHGPHDVARHPRVEVGRTRDAVDRHFGLCEPGVETLGVGPGDVEACEANVDAALPERRQQPEQVLLGARDARHLEQMDDPHRESRLRYRFSTSSTIRSRP